MRKAISIFLLFVLSFSFTGLTVAEHQCCGQIVDKGLECGMERMDCSKSEHTPVNEEFQSEQCCHNFFITISTDNITQEKPFRLIASAAFFRTSNTSGESILPRGEVKFIRFQNNSPPPITISFSILYQTFLL